MLNLVDATYTPVANRRRTFMLGARALFGVSAGCFLRSSRGSLRRRGGIPRAPVAGRDSRLSAVGFLRDSRRAGMYVCMLTPSRDTGKIIEDNSSDRLGPSSSGPVCGSDHTKCVPAQLSSGTPSLLLCCWLLYHSESIIFVMLLRFEARLLNGFSCLKRVLPFRQCLVQMGGLAWERVSEVL